MNEIFSKESIASDLILIGFTKESAERIYDEYKINDKLNSLKEYIDFKFSLVEKNDTLPLRDI